MNLLVDIGNTRIKWALQGGGDWKVGQPLSRQNKAFKDLARPAWKDLETPRRVIVSCVAGHDYAKSVHTWVKRRWKVAPEFLRSQASQCGVTNGYKDPERLGADRWAALIAVHDTYQRPVVIVDCGTAITVDAMDARGRHLGGLIVPGIELMSSSLAGHAPGIELLDNKTGDIPLLGGSTEAGVAGGVLYTAVSFIDRVFADLRAELGRTTQMLLTGGDAERIKPLLGSQPTVLTDLVLKGLAVYAASTEHEKTAPAPEAEEASGEAVEAEAAVCDS